MNPDTVQRLDALLQAGRDPAGPGLAVLVSRGGETVYRRGIGLADLETGRPLHADSVFRAGSLTKPFTAIAVLMLCEQGVLGLDDPVRAWLPAYPASGDSIRIEHLLTHSAGLPNYTGLPAWRDISTRDVGVDELIATFRDLPLLFEPGARHAYSNSGYALLGAIIEAAAARPYADFMRERVFEPLDMRSTCIDRGETPVPGLVTGYVRDAAGWRDAPRQNMSHPYAAGALTTTVSDLARWDAALRSGRLLRPETLARALTPYRLRDGSVSRYGHGWILTRCGGLAAHEHGGLIGGFTAYIVRVPEAELFVALLSNAAHGAPVQPLAIRLAEAALGVESSLPRAAGLDPRRFEHHAGVYRLGDGSLRRVTIEGGGLVTQRGDAPPVRWACAAENLFFDEEYPTVTLRFTASGVMELGGRIGPIDTAVRLAPST